MDGTINWVVALPAEASAVIDRFRLKHVSEPGQPFRIYEDATGSHRLIVSGVGKVASAAATAFLAANRDGNSPARSTEGWINFGIAGSGLPDFGSVFLASRVTDAGNGKSWYPPASWPRKKDLSRRELVTVDRPALDGIDSDDLVDMEGAGFYPIASRVSTAELCQVVKVVSDDPEHPPGELDKRKVQGLCRAGLEQAEPWIEAFCGLVAEEAAASADPAEFREWCERFPFTETQMHQLRRLLQEWHALHPGGGTPPLPDVAGRAGRSAALECLREEIGRSRAQRVGE